MKIVLALAALSLLPVSAHATDAENKFVGSYSLVCERPYQCFLDVIQPVRGGDTFALVTVADEKDAHNVICGYRSHVILNVYNELVGGENEWRGMLKITPASHGAVNVAGIPNKVCNTPLNGTYTALGD